MIEYRDLRVAVLGAGTVGSQVARILLERADELAARVGARMELVGIAVRDVDAPRDVQLPRQLLTTDAERLVLGADIVVELMGGIEPARTLLLQALTSGADVVTANKALLAAHGDELFDTAAQVGAQLYYEAAVAGAIPIIRPLSDSLAGDEVRRILGIVNGSTNYILDRMDRFGESAHEASARAAMLGYLEADPTLDVEGHDAAQKAAILAGLAFHTAIAESDVYREGITAVTAQDVASARAAGYVIKLLAIAERTGDPDTGAAAVSVRVHPALVPREHPLASVHEGNNAVFVEAEAAGSLMFYGAGAGGPETASAVLGDLVSAARRHLVGGPGVARSFHAELPVLPIGSVTTKYHITLEVDDEPGVLATIAGVFSEHRVSVASATQTITDGATGTATLVVGTHAALERSLAAVVDALRQSSAVQAVRSVIRIEGDQP